MGFPFRLMSGHHTLETKIWLVTPTGGRLNRKINLAYTPHPAVKPTRKSSTSQAGITYTLLQIQLVTSGHTTYHTRYITVYIYMTSLGTC